MRPASPVRPSRAGDPTADAEGGAIVMSARQRALGWAVLLLVVVAGCSKHGMTVNARGNMTMNTPVQPPVTTMVVDRQPAGVATQGRIALVDVDGLLVNVETGSALAQGENPVALFRERLDAVACDPCARAVVLRIHSHGGGVTACDIMRHDLVAFKRRTGLPVVACLMDVGTGGAYYLASAADVIVAHPTTVTGGLGVILNLYNLQDAMAQFNVLGVPIKAGPLADLGTPIAGLEEDQRALLQTMADEFHARFRRTIEAERGLNPAETDELFDGRIFTGEQAHARGLVDHIGYLDDAIEGAREASGLAAAQVVVYHRCTDKAFSVYDATPLTPIQAGLLPLSIPGLERSKLPTFLYIWQPEPTMERLSGR